MGASRHVYIKTACGDVTLHAWMSQTVMPHTHMSESCHAHGWVMPHTKWLMVSDPYERARHVSKRFTCHAWTSHVTRINETPHQTLTMHTHASCHTCEWIISHAFILQVVRVIVWAVWNILTSCVTPINESCHTYKRVRSHKWMRHVTRMNEWHHTRECFKSYISLECTSHVSLHTLAKIHTRTHTHTHTHRNVGNSSLTCRVYPRCTYEWVMSHLYTSHVLYINASCHTHEWCIPHAYESIVPHTCKRRFTHMNALWRLQYIYENKNT